MLKGIVVLAELPDAATFERLKDHVLAWPDEAALNTIIRAKVEVGGNFTLYEIRGIKDGAAEDAACWTLEIVEFSQPEQDHWLQCEHRWLRLDRQGHVLSCREEVSAAHSDNWSQGRTLWQTYSCGAWRMRSALKYPSKYSSSSSTPNLASV